MGWGVITKGCDGNERKRLKGLSVCVEKKRCVCVSKGNSRSCQTATMADGNIEIKLESDTEKEAHSEMERETQRCEQDHRTMKW